MFKIFFVCSLLFAEAFIIYMYTMSLILDIYDMPACYISRRLK